MQRSIFKKRDTQPVLPAAFIGSPATHIAGNDLPLYESIGSERFLGEANLEIGGGVENHHHHHQHSYRHHFHQHHHNQYDFDCPIKCVINIIIIIIVIIIIIIIIIVIIIISTTILISSIIMISLVEITNSLFFFFQYHITITTIITIIILQPHRHQNSLHINHYNHLPSPKFLFFPFSFTSCLKTT